MVREFEEKSERTRRRSLKKDTKRYAKERGLYLKLNYLCPTANHEEGEELPGGKVGVVMRIKEEESRTAEVRQQKWQGKLIKARWDDADVAGCFSLLCHWKTAPTHTMAGVLRMHVQYSLIETTRLHDLSIRKMHLIREDGRTAVPTNRSIRSIRDSLLRPVSIRVLHVAHFYAVTTRTHDPSTRKVHLIR